MSPIVTPYSHEQIISSLPAVVLHYHILSSLPECLEFPTDITGEVSVASMLSFSYENSVNIYSFIARVAYQLLQALYIDLHEHSFFRVSWQRICIVRIVSLLFRFSLSQCVITYIPLAVSERRLGYR